MKNFKTKVLPTLLSILLVIGAIVSVGFLAFAGILTLHLGILSFIPEIFIAISAFAFAGVIEGEVYRKNIFDGLTKIFTTDYFKRRYLISKLEELIIDDTNLKSTFITDYIIQKNYIKDLRKNLKTLHQKEKNEQNEAILKAYIKKLHEEEKRLQAMQDYFISYITKGNQKNLANFSEELDRDLSDLLGPRKITLRNTLRNKLIAIRLSWIFNIPAGLASFLTTIHMSHVGILAVASYFGFTLSAVALTTSIYILAAIALIAYPIIMYNNISEMIIDASKQAWFQKIRSQFQPPQGKTTNLDKFVYGMKIVGLSFLLISTFSLTVFATVCTAGTWWYAAKKGALLIPYLAKAAKYLRDISVPIMGIITLLFNVPNSFKSVSDILKISISSITKQLEAVGKKIDDAWDNETGGYKLQFFNPFRLVILFISIPFRFVFYIGHISSMGVTGDGFKQIPPMISFVTNTLSEGLFDGDYIFGDDHDHHLDNKKKNKHNHDDHDHSDIPGGILRVVLSPLYFASTLWDFTFSESGKRDFSKSLRKNFGDGVVDFFTATRDLIIKSFHFITNSIPKVFTFVKSKALSFVNKQVSTQEQGTKGEDSNPAQEIRQNQTQENQQIHRENLGRPLLSRTWYKYEVLRKIHKRIHYFEQHNIDDKNLTYLRELHGYVKNAKINENAQDTISQPLFGKNGSIFLNQSYTHAKLTKLIKKISENEVYNYSIEPDSKNAPPIFSAQM